METIEITTEYIKLQDLLKFAAAVQTGGEAKMVIQEGEVTVNGEVLGREARRLHAAAREEIGRGVQNPADRSGCIGFGGRRVGVHVGTPGRRSGIGRSARSEGEVVVVFRGVLGHRRAAARRGRWG